METTDPPHGQPFAPPAKYSPLRPSSCHCRYQLNAPDSSAPAKAPRHGPFRRGLRPRTCWYYRPKAQSEPGVWRTSARPPQPLPSTQGAPQPGLAPDSVHASQPDMGRQPRPSILEQCLIIVRVLARGSFDSLSLLNCKGATRYWRLGSAIISKVVFFSKPATPWVFGVHRRASYLRVPPFRL